MQWVFERRINGGLLRRTMRRRSQSRCTLPIRSSFWTRRCGTESSSLVSCCSKEDKVAIAKMLDAAGIHRIEAGTPSVSQEDADAIREICDSGLKAQIYCFTRNVVDDIKLAKSCGVDGVLTEVPGSEHMLQGGMKWNADKAIKAACETTQAAHEMGMKVAFSPPTALAQTSTSCWTRCRPFRRAAM